jgi:hypothetical protein
VLAIRKDTTQPVVAALKRGDPFDIVLIKIKGGSARGPTLEERRRLRAVARRFNANAVVLFEWRRGVVEVLYTPNSPETSDRQLAPAATRSFAGTRFLRVEPLA